MTNRHYMRARRAKMKQLGICVDCQHRDAARNHVLCETDLLLRRVREKKRYVTFAAKLARSQKRMRIRQNDSD